MSYYSGDRLFFKIYRQMKTEQYRYVIRNLGRKKKQTFFSLFCIGVASFIILVNMALNNGIGYQLKRGVNEAISGQLTAYSAANGGMNILESQGKEQRIFSWSAADSAWLRGEAPAITSSRRIRFGSLVSWEEETSYVQVHALEPAHLARLGALLGVEPSALPQAQAQILISETLASDLHCGVGDTLLLVAENVHEYMSDGVAAVSGVFQEEGLGLFLGYMGFVSYGWGEEMVGLQPGECLELVMNVAEGAEIPEQTALRIVGGLQKEKPEVTVASWEQTVPLFFTIASVWKGTGCFTQLIFLLFSLVILISLISLVVSSRKKEFGMLLAIGFSWRKITGMVCAEYILLTFCSVMGGCLLVYGLVYALPGGSFSVPSRDMQWAFMAAEIPLFLSAGQVLYVLVAFCLTVWAAVRISLSRLRLLSPVVLIHAN